MMVSAYRGNGIVELQKELSSLDPRPDVTTLSKKSDDRGQAHKSDDGSDTDPASNGNKPPTMRDQGRKEKAKLVDAHLRSLPTDDAANKERRSEARRRRPL